MTNYREKHNLRLRNCKLKISPNCLKIFKSKSKRPFACENCLKFLHDTGLTIERYKKMEVTESMEWENKDKGKISVKQETDVKNTAGKIIGKKSENFEIETTYTEVKEGLGVVKDRLEKNRKEMETLIGKIKAFDKAPVMTNELIRLKRNLELLTAIEKHNELKAKLEPLEEQLELDKEFVVKRSEILKSRPE